MLRGRDGRFRSLGERRSQWWPSNFWATVYSYTFLLATLSTPDRFADTEPADLASTLVHEMCHQYQQHHGSPGRQGYHNAEFADLMEARGLTTTSTGKKGGTRTGQRMDHLMVDNGPFRKSFAALGEGLFLPFRCLTSDGLAQ